jgi:DNA-binding IclR family transcriptional regulator
VDIKNQGVAEIFIENEYYAIAIPLLQRNGVLLGSIGLYMPAFRYTSVRRIELITALRQAADDITNRM